MKRCRKIAVATLSALFCFSGCVAGGYGEAVLRSGQDPLSAAGTGLLSAAGEEEEFGILLEKPKPRGPEAEGPSTPAERQWRLGLRAGMLVTGPSGEAWNAALCLGGYYRRSCQGHLVYELGVDLASVESADGSTTSRLLFLRGEALFGKWNTEGRGASVYALAGAQAIGEQAKLSGSGNTESRMGAGINLGLGLGSVKGAWDVRTVYSVLLGSDNAKGDFLVAAGLSF